MILGGGALYAITSQITKLLLENALKGVKPKVQEEIMKSASLSEADFDRIQKKAKTIFGAFHDSWFDEDEDKAINTINSNRFC